MNYIQTEIDGVWIIEPKIFFDPRGYFMEAFKQQEFDATIGQINFIQDNESQSSFGTLRGLHYQKGAYSQAKLVRVIKGEVLDGLGMRGVRCSCMDCEDTCAYEAQMGAKGLGGEHPSEALILASKVAAAPGTVAELCWSDDPFYVTGYVGSPKFGYGRITVMKEKGDPIGGRVFFVKHGTDMDRYVEYMQHQTVLVRIK